MAGGTELGSERNRRKIHAAAVRVVFRGSVGGGLRAMRRGFRNLSTCWRSTAM